MTFGQTSAKTFLAGIGDFEYAFRSTLESDAFRLRYMRQRYEEMLRIRKCEAVDQVDASKLEVPRPNFITQGVSPRRDVNLPRQLATHIILMSPIAGTAFFETSPGSITTFSKSEPPF
jgi:hypothetical protein